MTRATAQLPRFAAGFCAALVWLVGFRTVAVSRAENAERAGTNQILRLAFLSSMFSEVNESDARAAMKVWILTVAKERNIAVDPDPHVFRTVDELAACARTNHLDGVGLLASEYARLSQIMKFKQLGVGDYPGGISEEYVVLVNTNGGAQRLDQLQGRTLNVLNSPRTSLATIWLDTELMAAGLKRCTNFFRQINYNNKASLVTLPVFFRQVDACLTTRSSFNVLGELNPQLTRQLRVLAVSPAVLPTCFAFCADSELATRPEIPNEMTHLGDSPAGQQILTLVKADRIVVAPISSLDSALALVAKHQRLCAATSNQGGNP